MQFLDDVYKSAPLQLKPDRPASQYMLSYEQYRLDEMAKHVQNFKETDYLQQISKLTEFANDKQRQGKQKCQKLLQGMLMCQIEIERLRQILCEWDLERRKVQDQTVNIQRIYRLKLEQLKRELSNQFEEELINLKIQNDQDLNQMKQTYINRIGQINIDIHKFQDIIANKEMDIQSKQTKIHILEANAQELMAKMEIKAKTFKEIQLELIKLKQEIRQEKDENSRMNIFRTVEGERMKQQNLIKAKENQQIKSVLMSLKNTLEQVNAHCIDLQQNNKKLIQKIDYYEVKCKTLQKQIQQFKSRKTQHNGFVRQELSDHKSSVKNKRSPMIHLNQNINGSSNKTMGIKNSQDDYEYKINQLQKELEDKEYIILQLRKEIESQQVRRGQQNQSIKREEPRDNKKNNDIRDNRVEELEQLYRKKDQQIRDLEQIIQRKNYEISNRQRNWAERLGQFQKMIDDMNQQWLKKERQYTNLFKSIEQNYLKKMDEIGNSINEKDMIIAQKTIQNSNMMDTLTQKVKQLAMLQQQVKKK